VNGDLKKAFEWLRKKGQASVAKSSRATNEGLVGVAVLGPHAVIVEVSSSSSSRSSGSGSNSSDSSSSSK